VTNARNWDVVGLQRGGHRIDLILMLDIANQDFLIRKELGNFLPALFRAHDQNHLGTSIQKGFCDMGCNTLLVRNTKHNHSLSSKTKKI
jgi:hypothetical protein